MNAFALLLLAWPVYLAVNGKLINYTKLATTSAAPSSKGSVSESTLGVQPLGGTL